jgi:hypothetical protein
VIYRLERVSDILAIDLENPEIQLQSQLAINLHQMSVQEDVKKNHNKKEDNKMTDERYENQGLPYFFQADLHIQDSSFITFSLGSGAYKFEMTG